MGKKARRKKEEAARRNSGQTPGRLLASWQKALLWLAWLGWLAFMFANSASVYMGWKEFGSLALAVAVTVWCVRHPLGWKKVYIKEPGEVRGSFESRTNWALVLVGALLTLGGLSAVMKMIQDLRSGHTTVGGIFSDMGVFLIKWYHEKISGGTYDAELEKTEGYILFVLAIPGFFMLLICLMPWICRGLKWNIDARGELSVWRGGAWLPIRESDYELVEADGMTIEFKEAEGSAPAVVLPQDRVYSRELNTRVADHVLAAFFRERLEKKAFAVESRSKDLRVETAWVARRKAPPKVE